MLVIEIALAIVLACVILFYLPVIIAVAGIATVIAIAFIAFLAFLGILNSIPRDLIYSFALIGIAVFMMVKLSEWCGKSIARAEAKLRRKQDSKNYAISMLQYLIKRQKLQWSEDNQKRIEKLKEQLLDEFEIDEAKLRTQFSIIYD